MTYARAVLVVLALTAPAAAQKPSREVTRQFQAGVDAYRLGDYATARDKLEAARALDPKLPGPHRFLAAVAQAERRWDDCIASARTALALNPRSQELADTRELHDDCRAAAGRPGFVGELGDSAAIAVTSNVTGAVVRIAGLTYGGTPIAPRRIPAGTVTVELEKAGYQKAQREIEALPGVVTDVAIDLAPESATAIADRERATRAALVFEPDVLAGATLSIDGRVVALPPNGRLVLAPGAHVVEVRKPGFRTWQQRITAETGDQLAVTPALVPGDARPSRLPYYLVGAAVAVAAAGAIVYFATRDGEQAPSARVTPSAVGITLAPGGGIITTSVTW